MNDRRGRRVLLAAFAISILLHLLGGNTLHWTIPMPVEQSERLSVSHIAIIRVAHNTPPPRPVVLPTIAPLKTLRPISVPRTSAVRGRLSTLPVATVAPVVQFTTPEPTPTVPATPSAAPSAAGGCGKPDAPAAVLKKSDAIEIPLAARATAVNAVAQVRVALDAQGQVTGALIANSSGSAALDAVAENYARASTYTPSYQACKPVASNYLFRVRFSSQ